MADGRHFENRYISIIISAENRPNMTKFGMLTQILTLSTEMWEKKSEIPKFKMADGRHFGYNSTPCCPIKTKFGIRRHNRTHTKVRWWKFQILKIQHGGWPPFWKWLDLHISAANCPNFTKLSMRSQIVSQARKRDQKIRNSQIQDGGRTPYWKSYFCL